VTSRYKRRGLVTVGANMMPPAGIVTHVVLNPDGVETISYDVPNQSKAAQGNLPTAPTRLLVDQIEIGSLRPHPVDPVTFLRRLSHRCRRGGVPRQAASSNQLRHRARACLSPARIAAGKCRIAHYHQACRKAAVEEEGRCFDHCRRI
jgi:hypothetical protein